MTTEEAVQQLRDCVARKHLARNTGRSYAGWLERYCEFIRLLPGHGSSEEKLELFLSAPARDNVAFSTQNQAFNAILFSEIVRSGRLRISEKKMAQTAGTSRRATGAKFQSPVAICFIRPAGTLTIHLRRMLRQSKLHPSGSR